jgi:hypothetical protein
MRNRISFTRKVDSEIPGQKLRKRAAGKVTTILESLLLGERCRSRFFRHDATSFAVPKGARRIAFRWSSPNFANVTGVAGADAAGFGNANRMSISARIFSIFFFHLTPFPTDLALPRHK